MVNDDSTELPEETPADPEEAADPEEVELITLMMQATPSSAI